MSEGSREGGREGRGEGGREVGREEEGRVEEVTLCIDVHVYTCITALPRSPCGAEPSGLSVAEWAVGRRQTSGQCTSKTPQQCRPSEEEEEEEERQFM